MGIGRGPEGEASAGRPPSDGAAGSLASSGRTAARVSCVAVPRALRARRRSSNSASRVLRAGILVASGSRTRCRRPVVEGGAGTAERVVVLPRDVGGRHPLAQAIGKGLLRRCGSHGPGRPRTPLAGHDMDPLVLHLIARRRLGVAARPRLGRRPGLWLGHGCRRGLHGQRGAGERYDVLINGGRLLGSGAVGPVGRGRLLCRLLHSIQRGRRSTHHRVGGTSLPIVCVRVLRGSTVVGVAVVRVARQACICQRVHIIGGRQKGAGVRHGFEVVDTHGPARVAESALELLLVVVFEVRSHVV